MTDLSFAPGSRSRVKTEPRTSLAMVALFEATLPQLQVLADIVAAHALRHANRPVPAQLLGDAEVILGTVRRVLSREAGVGRLALGVPPDWAELHGKLALALAGFRSFRARYYGFDPHVEACRWRTAGPRLPRLPQLAARTLVRRATAQLERQIDRLEHDLP